MLMLPLYKCIYRVVVAGAILYWHRSNARSTSVIENHAKSFIITLLYRS